nr:hypothetical protein HmN_001012500 [Hymenolepis microstoma]
MDYRTFVEVWNEVGLKKCEDLRGALDFLSHIVIREWTNEKVTRWSGRPLSRAPRIVTLEPESSNENCVNEDG